MSGSLRPTTTASTRCSSWRPSSTKARLERTTAACRGFVYATAVMGVTGTREQTSRVAPELVARVHDVTALPVGVGLGVSDGRQAGEVASYAEAVIVGSAFVRAVLDADGDGAAIEAVATPDRRPGSRCPRGTLSAAS